MNPAQTPIRASTQEHLDIEDVKDNIVIFKDGSCCIILQTTAVNFGLLSEKEQDATIYAYGELLNSLSFTIQVFIRSQQKDISSYLKLLDNEINKKKPRQIKEWLKKYYSFIEETVKNREILDKNFYVIIPFSTTELGVASSISSSFKKSQKLPYPIDYILEKAKNNLYPKRDHMIKQLTRIGLNSRQLETKELIRLFYQIYNPESEGQKFTSSENYTRSLVQAAIKKQQEKQNG